MTEPVFRISDDPAGTLAEELAAQARAGGSIVLTGGRTPGKAYEQAARLAPDWSNVEVWWGDERAVSPDDELSNYRLAKETLLDRLERGPREVHRIRGELQPADAAAEYGRALQGTQLDLLLLGMGADGHIASLFPGSPQLRERERLVTSGEAGLEPFVERVTMTLPAILGARRIALLVSGEDKAEAVARAFGRDITEDVPASLLRTGSAPLEVFLDLGAASKLDNEQVPRL